MRKSLQIVTAALFAVSPLIASSSLYENDCSMLKIAENPLSNKAVEIILKQPQSIYQIKDTCFADIWQARFIAEQHLSDAGYKNCLCYSKLKSDVSPTWQIVPYSSLPWYLDNLLFRKIYSVWKQAAVLFRTTFQTSPLSKEGEAKVYAFWSVMKIQVEEEGSNKTGSGALTRNDIIQKQLIYPTNVLNDDNEVLLLYNYAPLRTGGEQMHFMLVPNPNKSARDFLELDKEQYINVLSLSKKVAQWAEKEFGKSVTIHFFDKTGEIAGQTQPLYHAHLIIVKEEKEETWGKLAMFLRMIIPSRPLPSNELERRVTHYRESLGSFINHQD